MSYLHTTIIFILALASYCRCDQSQVRHGSYDCYIIMSNCHISNRCRVLHAYSNAFSIFNDECPAVTKNNIGHNNGYGVVLMDLSGSCALSHKPAARSQHYS